MGSVSTASSVTSAALEHRLTDRRRSQSILNRHTLFGGRRRAARRAKERWGYIADQHGLVLFVSVVSLAVLNIADAFYTVLFLSYGGTELNPFVDWVLRHGGFWGFLAVKTLGIGLCVAFLTLTKNFRASRFGLGIVLIGYFVLLGWHLHLLDRLPY